MQKNQSTQAKVYNFGPQRQRPEYYFHSLEQQKDGSYFITMWDKNKTVSEGDEMMINALKYIVVEILENRSHRGIFNNPQDAENTFFKLRCVLA
jgi:hypothetical protein